MPHATIVGKKDISIQCALNTLRQSSPERSIPNILAISTICARSILSINCLGKLAIVISLPKISRILKQHSCLLFKLCSKHFLQMKRPAMTTMMRRTRTPLDRPIAMSVMTTTIYMVPFHGWVFKRLGCELIGAHFSLLFCQIQSSFIVILLFLVLGCPLGIIEPIQYGVFVLIAYMPSPHAIRVQYLRSFCRHVKFRTASPQTSSALYSLGMPCHASRAGVQAYKLPTMYSSLNSSETSSQISLLGLSTCSHASRLVAWEMPLQPLPMDSFHSTFHSIVNDYWERIVHLFLSTHDPSQLMQFHLHFAQPAAMALDMGFAVGSSPPVCSQVGIR